VPEILPTTAALARPRTWRRLCRGGCGSIRHSIRCRATRGSRTWWRARR